MHLERNKTETKVTLDTNILVSASFWKGNSYRILLLMETRSVVCILSSDIIEEYKKVMESEYIVDKINDKNLIINKIVSQLISMSTIVNPKMKLNVIKEDPDDNKIIECAIEGKSNFIITNDKHLLRIKSYRKIRIITPEDFLSMIYYK